MPILPLAAGLTSTGGTTQATVTELLTTSDGAFSKVAGYDLTTYEKEDGDIDGRSPWRSRSRSTTAGR